MKKRVSSELSDDKIEKIYQTFGFIFIIQRTCRAFKLRPETWAKQVWNMVRNDGTPDKKKFLSPRGKRDIYDPYVWYIDRKILAKDLPESFLNNLYDGHIPREWAEKKSDQLHNRLGNIAYIVAFIVLHQQNYRIITYDGDWSYMLKWLSNPKYYRINKYYNNGNVNFVKSKALNGSGSI
ncbi:1711_t:CDS:2 [Rhizophagus irregularis]|nr:1711_t:CDS:2 [Rhizophagus irregularis]